MVLSDTVQDRQSPDRGALMLLRRVDEMEGMPTLTRVSSPSAGAFAVGMPILYTTGSNVGRRHP